ncbi:conjugal transfer protein, partial [uncultured Holdemanella sp.]
QVKEGEQTQAVTENYTVTVHVDKDGVMVITQNPTLAPVSGDYVFSELVNPVFTKDGDNLKVSVSVKYLDNKSKMTQISQYELVLHKDDNWKIVE